MNYAKWTNSCARRRGSKGNSGREGNLWRNQNTGKVNKYEGPYPGRSAARRGTKQDSIRKVRIREEEVPFRHREKRRKSTMIKERVWVFGQGGEKSMLASAGEKWCAK